MDACVGQRQSGGEDASTRCGTDPLGVATTAPATSRTLPGPMANVSSLVRLANAVRDMLIVAETFRVAPGGTVRLPGLTVTDAPCWSPLGSTPRR